MIGGAAGPEGGPAAAVAIPGPGWLLTATLAAGLVHGSVRLDRAAAHGVGAVVAVLPLWS